MAVSNNSGLALSRLYEASDLLNLLRGNGEDPGPSLTPQVWTVTGEVSRRLNDAIAVLDEHVPHPADPEPAGNERDGPRYQRVINAQIELEELEGLAKLAAANCENEGTTATVPLMSAFGVIERRAREIRGNLDGLLD